MAETQQQRPLKPLVTGALLQYDQVLLVRYSPPIDDQGGWILPTDEVEDKARPDDTAGSVLKKQLSVKPGALVLSHLESSTGRDGA